MEFQHKPRENAEGTLRGHLYRSPDYSKEEYVSGQICERCGAVSDESSSNEDCIRKDKVGARIKDKVPPLPPESEAKSC